MKTNLSWILLYYLFSSKNIFIDLETYLKYLNSGNFNLVSTKYIGFSLSDLCKKLFLVTHMILNSEKKKVSKLHFE